MSQHLKPVPGTATPLSDTSRLQTCVSGGMQPARASSHITPGCRKTDLAACLISLHVCPPAQVISCPMDVTAPSHLREALGSRLTCSTSRKAAAVAGLAVATAARSSACLWLSANGSFCSSRSRRRWPAQAGPLK